MRIKHTLIALGYVTLALAAACCTGCASTSSRVPDNSVFYFNVSDRVLTQQQIESLKDRVVYVMVDAGGEHAEHIVDVLEEKGIHPTMLSGINSIQTNNNAMVDSVFLHVDSSSKEAAEALPELINSFIEAGYTFGTWS